MVHAGPGSISELEDFAIVIGDDTQLQKYVAVAAQLQERAAGDVQVQEVPAAAQPQERAAGDVLVQTSATATREELAATIHLQAEEAPDSTEIVAYTNVFQVEKVNPLPVGSTTVFIDSAASNHMVSADSRISQHLVKTFDCNVRKKGSCGTSSTAKKGTLTFGIRGAQGKIIPVALEVLLVRDRSEHRFGRNFGRKTGPNGICSDNWRRGRQNRRDALVRCLRSNLADPPAYDDEVSGPNAEGWIASMGDERQSLIDHDVFEWVDPPDDAQLLPSRFLYNWKRNQDGIAFRQKSGFGCGKRADCGLHGRHYAVWKQRGTHVDDHGCLLYTSPSPRD